MKANLKVIMALVVVGLLVGVATSVALGALQAKKDVAGHGSSASIGVDALSGTTSITDVNFGLVVPGQSSSQIFTIKNTGSIAADVTFSWDGLVPAGSGVTVVCDKPSIINLAPGATTPVTVTATLPSAFPIATDFSFNMHYTAVPHP